MKHTFPQIAQNWQTLKNLRKQPPKQLEKQGQNSEPSGYNFHTILAKKTSIFRAILSPTAQNAAKNVLQDAPGKILKI